MEELIFRLLDSWREKGHFGLTLPFIYGALKYSKQLSGGTKDSFQSLINSIESSRVTTRLSYCDKADDLILAPINSVPVDCDRVTRNGSPTALWVQHNIVDNQGTISEVLFDVLWAKYRSNLEAEHYSCAKGHYHPLNQNDINFINEAFAKNA